LTEIGDIFDKGIFDSINSFDQIQETERQLEEMKTTIQDKKLLQKERNVLTAQLSRNRKKIENQMLRDNCLALIKMLNQARNTALDLSEAGCQNCSKPQSQVQESFDFLFQGYDQYQTSKLPSTEDSECSTKFNLYEDYVN